VGAAVRELRRPAEGGLAEYEEWRRRPLGDLEAVYLWADGIYVKAGLEREKAAVRGGEAEDRGGE